MLCKPCNSQIKKVYINFRGSFPQLFHSTHPHRNERILKQRLYNAEPHASALTTSDHPLIAQGLHPLG